MPHKVESRLLFATKFWYIYCITTTTPTCHATKLEENTSDWFFQVPIMLPCKELIHARPTVATCFWDSFAVLGQFFPRIPKAIKLWLQLSGFFLMHQAGSRHHFCFYRSRFSTHACIWSTNQRRGLRNTVMNTIYMQQRILLHDELVRYVEYITCNSTHQLAMQ